MKPILFQSIGLLFLMTCVALEAQKVSFTYDNAGNRIDRTLEEVGGGLKSLAMSDTVIVEDEIIEEEMIKGEIKIFPNPTDGKITIDFFPDDQGSYYLSVTNLTGYRIIERLIFGGKNELDISGYSPGIYVITIFSEEKSNKWVILKI